jgi:DNA-binding transcriptional regulator YiaG
MDMEKKFQSEQLMVIHDMAKALSKIGAIDGATMREFDADCLVPVSKPAQEAPGTAGMEHISPASAGI